jgi:hypothetical protein
MSTMTRVLIDSEDMTVIINKGMQHYHTVYYLCFQELKNQKLLQTINKSVSWVKWAYKKQFVYFNI